MYFKEALSVKPSKAINYCSSNRSYSLRTERTRVDGSAEDRVKLSVTGILTFFLSKPCYNTFTSLQNDTKTPRENNQPNIDRGTNHGLFQSILEKNVRIKLKKVKLTFFKVQFIQAQSIYDQRYSSKVLEHQNSNLSKTGSLGHAI